MAPGRCAVRWGHGVDCRADSKRRSGDASVTCMLIDPMMENTMISLTVPSSLTQGAAHRTTVQLTAATLRQALDAAAAEFPAISDRVLDGNGGLRHFAKVYIDGEDCAAIDGLDSSLPPGANVEVISAVSGG